MRIRPRGPLMRFGLCMIVKDEAARLSQCLEPVLEAASEVVILDNESTDGTPELLRTRYGIEALPVRLSEDRCYCYSEHRNLGFDALSTPWVLCLDADERLEAANLRRLADMEEEPGVAGYFGLWRTELPGGAAYDDYKLFLFRRGFNKRGLVHDNVQIDIREKGGHARWLEGLEVAHHPDPGRVAWKKRFYRQRLACAIKREPDWIRYHWFLGYSLFQDGEAAEAEPWLRAAAESRSHRFPVECLNSGMVLGELLAARGRAAEAAEVLEAAQAFFGEVRDDFEVAINFRAGPWLETAVLAAREGRTGDIHAYRFAR